MGPYPWAWTRADPTEVARANVRVDALQRRVLFMAKHRDFSWALPWETESGKWEVTTPADGVLSYAHGVAMMDDLEARYPV